MECIQSIDRSTEREREIMLMVRRRYPVPYQCKIRNSSLCSTERVVSQLHDISNGIYDQYTWKVLKWMNVNHAPWTTLIWIKNEIRDHFINTIWIIVVFNKQFIWAIWQFWEWLVFWKTFYEPQRSWSQLSMLGPAIWSKVSWTST